MPSPPDPIVPPPRPPRPVPPGRPLPMPAVRSADDEDAERLLTRANIQLRRGLTAEAEAAVHSLLGKRPKDAGAWELLADIRLSRGDLPGAQQALKTSLEAQPGRATAEMKLGRAALQASERERMQTMGMAYAASDASLVRFGGGSGRGGQWAALGSALIPGLGQGVNGEVVKGIVVASVYFLSLLLLALLPDTQNLLHSVAGVAAGGHGRRGGSAAGGGVSAVSVLLFLVMTAAWVYGIVDAARASRRAAAPPKNGDWQP
jgi:hypothetical protein